MSDVGSGRSGGGEGVWHDKLLNIFSVAKYSGRVFSTSVAGPAALFGSLLSPTVARL
jgi:hypothetical protein